MKGFAGGIHPHDHKELSREQAIRPLPAPETVILPMSQHIGVPCVPTVKKGDAVALGQLVGEPDPSNPRHFVSAGVHASVSGTVRVVEPRPHPLGGCVDAVVIENDGQDTWVSDLPAEVDPSTLDATAIRTRIQEAGIVGMGGATFPTHVKLTPPTDTPIDTLVLNAAECEPYLTCDHRVMLEQPDKLVEGLRVSAAVVGATNLYIGIEANKQDAFEVLSKAAAGTDVRVVMCPVRYPQGAEKQLIFALTARRVPAGGLPMAVGVIAMNVGTSCAIVDAVRHGRPVTERVVTVTGDGVERPANLLCRIGTPVQALLDECGVVPGARRLILGGPMMGIAQRSADVPVIKGTSGVLVMRDGQAAGWRACIHCGACVEACPMRLMPNEISIACETQNVDAIGATAILHCYECGCCTYVCPSKRPIVQWVKFGKAELAKQKARQSNEAR
jgi:electron transport complex protein RnfC